MLPFLEKNFSSNPEGKTEDDRGVNKQLRTVMSSDIVHRLLHSYAAAVKSIVNSAITDLVVLVTWRHLTSYLSKSY